MYKKEPRYDGNYYYKEKFISDPIKWYLDLCGKGYRFRIEEDSQLIIDNPLKPVERQKTIRFDMERKYSFSEDNCIDLKPFAEFRNIIYTEFKYSVSMTLARDYLISIFFFVLEVNEDG